VDLSHGKGKASEIVTRGVFQENQRRRTSGSQLTTKHSSSKRKIA